MKILQFAIATAKTGATEQFIRKDMIRLYTYLRPGAKIVPVSGSISRCPA
jgi:hypothetical protein